MSALDQVEDAKWQALVQKRLLRGDDSAILESIVQSKPKNYFTQHEVRVGGCRDTKEIAKAFAEPMSFPSWYGENLDALYDLLNDIESGYHIVTVSGVASLDKNLRLKLEMVLKEQREPGGGYGSGQVVFVLK